MTPWQATSTVSWITINGGPTTGSGILSYTLQPNVTNGQREGTIVYEGRAIAITQDYVPWLINLSAAHFGVVDHRRASLARDSLVAMFGQDLAGTTQSADSVPLPTTLGGTRVRIKDTWGLEHDAPLIFVSPGQINYLLPASVATGFASVTVTNQSSRTQTGTLAVADLEPGLFSANSDGRRVLAGVLIRVKADGSQTIEPVANYDQAQQKYVPRPIEFGADPAELLYLVLFGTGFRNLTSHANFQVSTNFTIPTTLHYVGPQGAFVGLDQINVQLHGGFTNVGRVFVSVDVNGFRSNSVEIEFKR